MKLNSKDPKLTAYVLGELDPKERALIEEALKDPQNQEAQTAVEKIRKTVGRLAAAFQQETQQTEGLLVEQKQQLQALAQKDKQKPAKKSRWAWKLAFGFAGAAACVLLVVSVDFFTLEKGLDSRSNLSPPDSRMDQPKAELFAPAEQPVLAQKAEEPMAGVGLLGKGKGGGGAAMMRNHSIRIQSGDFNTEAYDRIHDNAFKEARQNPLSTFSIDVDTASYANLRRFLSQGTLPPPDSVRIEEMINYFQYDYPKPQGAHPFSVTVEVAQAPWAMNHRLMRIGLKGREIAFDRRPASNLVFLLDVSGSMEDPNKLPLVKRAMQLLVNQLAENDRVALVVYAGSSGLVLPSTSCDKKEIILQALENLEAGGSTNGGQGIQLAYDTALSNFVKGGTNRVILATDGDFNVGTTNQGQLIRLIEEKAKLGIFLTVLGFGMGNYKDSTLEKLADKGNGNYAYIDSFSEAKKVFVQQIGGTLVTIAKDVKVQVEFNPAKVQAYRLIGYENRLLAAEDFNDDTKDAGEIGSGHTVTALYEIVPMGVPMDLPRVDALKYQKPQVADEATTDTGKELLTVKLRYKEPDGDKSKLIEHPVVDSDSSLSKSSQDFQFAASVAAFGMLLRNSEFKGNASFDQVLEFAETAKGKDQEGYRAEFIKLVKLAKEIPPQENR